MTDAARQEDEEPLVRQRAPLPDLGAPGALVLEDARGELVFEDVSFKYAAGGGILLSDVTRPGQMAQVDRFSDHIDHGESGDGDVKAGGGSHG